MLGGITCVWVFRTGILTEGEMVLLLGTVSGRIVRSCDSA